MPQHTLNCRAEINLHSPSIHCRAHRKRFRAFARTLCAALLLTLFSCFATDAFVAAQTKRSTVTEQRETSAASYRVDLKIDFDRRAFEGTERVVWRNRADSQTSVLYFHLYANLRAAEDNAADRRTADVQAQTTNAKPVGSRAPTASEQAASLDPLLEIIEVRAAAIEATGVTTTTDRAPLAFALDDTATLLRVNLQRNVQPGASVAIEIKFRGSVPEISPDETSLTAHLLQQVGAATRDTRETRAGRDTNFLCRNTMLLGAPFPVLAVRDADGDWQRRVEQSIGDVMFADTADYAVTIETARGIQVFTSAPEVDASALIDMKPQASGQSASATEQMPNAASLRRHFAAADLRLFAIIAGRDLRVEEKSVAGVSVRSIFTMEHERTGRRALQIAADSARIFTQTFGAPPYKQITVVEAPLVAGLGAYEFSALNSIASAYYIDFDAPALRLLPDIIREQRQSVEDSFEWTVAHTIAQQWWGAGAVGNDPEREPFLDEALAHWSALHYFRTTHGEARAREASEDQLRGVYEIYRTFGGDDREANRAARDYRNSFQYAAIVSTKGALMFEALRLKLGEERFTRALRNYYTANRLLVAERNDLEAAFVGEATLAERRDVTRLFDRWLAQKRGDEDIATPNQQLADAIGISSVMLSAPNANDAKTNEQQRNRFVRLGKFFWRRMTRIR